MQTGVRAQAQSSSSISNKMCIAMKALCKHCWVQYVKWKPLIWYASSVHWVHSDTVTCYKADPVRYTLSESGLCWADLQRDSMGWVKDEHSCLNVSAFFGGGTDRLVFGTAAAERREAGGGQIKIAPPRLLSTSSHSHREVLNEALQLNRSCSGRNSLIFFFFHHPWELMSIPTVFSPKWGVPLQSESSVSFAANDCQSASSC